MQNTSTDSWKIERAKGARQIGRKKITKRKVQGGSKYTVCSYFDYMRAYGRDFRPELFTTTTNTPQAT
jgi:hypothetical protein